MRRILAFALTVTLLAQGFVHSAYALVPNDTFYGLQWYLEHINMEEAWDTTVGSERVVVAVIDTGVDIYHEDLAENIWSNYDEKSGNGVDDDGNGFIDDIHGWNFVARSNDVRPWGDAGTNESFVHGTLVASIIGAKGNNGIGIAGIAWDVTIMPIVALDQNGNGSTDVVANAIYYAVLNGADIINLSIEGDLRDVHFEEALAFAKSRGVLTVTVAGNSDDPGGRDLDIAPVYPACLSLEQSFGIITAGGTNANDRKARFANYGSCVSVSAPSDDIFAARPVKTGAQGQVVAPGYEGGYSGTSLAAPFLSGIAALLKSRHPHWGPAELRERLIAGTVPIDDANDKRYIGELGSGRIDAALALNDAQFISQEVGTLTLQATEPGASTRVRIVSEDGVVEAVPFEPDDTRGARAAFVDIDEDGVPEVAVVPASGERSDWALLGKDGQVRVRGEFPGGLSDGALVAGVRGGFVAADASGGRAWGVDAELIVHTFYPYGAGYGQGFDMLEIDGHAAFAPRKGGGRLVITDVYGKQAISAFPFGVDVSGRWALAKTRGGQVTHLLFSGPLGTKKLGSKELGQTGWQDVSFHELESMDLVLSSGQYTDTPSVRTHDEWAGGF